MQNKIELKPGEILANETALKQFNITDLTTEKLVISGQEMEFHIPQERV